jgi:hypothetical protein
MLSLVAGSMGQTPSYALALEPQSDTAFDEVITDANGLRISSRSFDAADRQTMPLSGDLCRRGDDS